jgi:hypothetical protein
MNIYHTYTGIFNVPVGKAKNHQNSDQFRAFTRTFGPRWSAWRGTRNLAIDFTEVEKQDLALSFERELRN